MKNDTFNSKRRTHRQSISYRILWGHLPSSSCLPHLLQRINKDVRIVTGNKIKGFL